MKRTNRIIFLLVAFILVPLSGIAQTTGTMDSNTMFLVVLVFTFIAALLVLTIAIFVLKILKSLLATELEKKADQGIEVVYEPSALKKWWVGLTGAVPIEQEDTIMLDHDYDGIKELDNHLPPWWRAMYYGGIVFGIVYMLVYHVFDALPLQTQEYETEIIKAEEAALIRLASNPGGGIDESNVVFSDDPSILSAGKQVYNNNCSTCHRVDGGGGIGPNMTDEYWIHGGDIKDIFSTIKIGVAEKGMISWEPLLSPTQMSNVSSYILSLQGPNPPGAKEKQGEKYIPAEVVETDAQNIEGSEG